MPLGGSTQQFRSYGKRKTNVINKRQALGGWDTSPVGGATGGAGDDSSESSSSSSDSEEEEPVLSRPTVKKVVPVARAKKAPVELVIEAPSLPRRPSARPSQLPSRRTADSTDKENSSTSSRSSLIGPPPSKKPVENVPPKQPAVQRVPLSLKGRQPAKPSVPPAPALERKKVEEPVASAAEESEDVVGPAKRAGRAARRKLVIADDSEDSPTSPTSAASTSSSASPSSSVAFAQPPVDAGSLTGAPSTVPPANPEPLAPKTRRRSTHPSALPPRSLPSPSTHPAPSAIAPLFPHLLHPTIFSFTSFISSPPSPPFSSAPFPLWRKIGEASYSEVFVTDAGGGEDLVVKIIPIAPADTSAKAPTEEEEELPYMSDWEAVMREIEVSRALGGEDGLDGFVNFKGAFLVQGSYPQELLASWDEYKASQYPPSDEQIRPHVLPSSQLYALILLSHAGSDLETYKLKTWRDAASVFVQVTQTLSVAEEEKGFEHRDLHWGNILVRPVSPSPADIPRRLASLRLSDPPSCDTDPTPAPALPFLSSPPSFRATLIDFTLSRCALPANRIAADPFSDECIFQGEGDLQFDVYRWMREVVEREGGEWEGRHTKTNVLWLYYLVHKLLHDKKLRPPADLAAKSTSHAFPSSPARPAPSPRKPVRRISSFASSSSLPLSPLAPSRKVRTMPASYLPGGRNHSLFLKEQEEERRAWEWLKGVEEELERCLERWGLHSGKEGRKGSAKKAGPKSRKVAVQQALEGGFASAGEVWRWIVERGEEVKR